MLKCSERHRLLDALSSLSSAIASGGFPPDCMSLFTAARLIALPKKSGGVRPIAVGDTLRRVAAKCLLDVVILSASEYLLPLQVGVQLPNAAERVARHVRLWSQSRAEYEVILQVDMRNAFNTLQFIPGRTTGRRLWASDVFHFTPPFGASTASTASTQP